MVVAGAEQGLVDVDRTEGERNVKGTPWAIRGSAAWRGAAWRGCVPG